VPGFSAFMARCFLVGLGCLHAGKQLRYAHVETPGAGGDDLKRSQAELRGMDGYTRSNNFGRIVFSPLATFSIFTRDTFLTPRSMPL
jgi:hypothetical protein